MYYLTLKYEDGHYEEFEHVIKVEYSSIAQPVSVSGDDLFVHKFPLSYDMHIFSDKQNVIISHKGLMRIDVEKE